MYILGITGGPNTIDCKVMQIPNGSFHDSSAVLLKDGAIITAFEEERLIRIKHTNLFPKDSILQCLKHLPDDVDEPDFVACSIDYDFLKKITVDLSNGDECKIGSQNFMQEILLKHTGLDIPEERIKFYDHHFCHAAGAYYQSGFDECLVITFDGAGDGFSGRVYIVRANQFQLLRSFSVSDSLGYYYLYITQHLGFDLFDEYKIMGLAPYGDPEKYCDKFDEFYELLSDGMVRINQDKLYQIKAICKARKKEDPLDNIHKDIAAALQDSLEKMIFHVVQYFKDFTGCTKLCLSGGVALNCKMTGELHYKRLFKDIFVHPASSDDGLSVGAALACYYQHVPYKSNGTGLKSLYWGSDIGEAMTLEREMGKWDRYLSFERLEDPSIVAAALLSENFVVGWFQGCSEFGPRALGNRSILADPRPIENRDRINAIIKMREGFRPFAPSVMEEFVETYFSLPDTKTSFPFMTFILKVQPQYRALLQAVTHLDGTARVQTVNFADNRRYWNLINAFYDFTGIPMVLNTSFNTNFEPIVDTPRQSILCYLTTELDYLIIGDYLLHKKESLWKNFSYMRVDLPKYVQLVNHSTNPVLRNLFDGVDFPVSINVRNVILGESITNFDGTEVLGELKWLLTRRLIEVDPDK